MPALRTIGLIAGLLVPMPSLAQSMLDRGSACVDSLDPAKFHRVPVLLNATVPDAQWKAILPSADLLAQSVALRVRALLGATESDLPAADSLVNWKNLWGTILVTATRDGRFSSHVHSSSARALDDPRSVLVLVRRALDEVSATGELMMWPEGLSGDSARFSLTIHRPIVNKAGVVQRVALRQPAPMFTIRAPWESPVEIRRGPRIHYPEISRTNAAIGGVRFAFIVKADGKADIESVEEVWPENVQRPTGHLLVYYDAFKAAVRRGLPSAQFHPAMIGGCPQRQLVIESFEFKLDRPSR